MLVLLLSLPFNTLTIQDNNKKKEDFHSVFCYTLNILRLSLKEYINEYVTNH